MLQVENISAGYGRTTVLRELSLTLGAGEMIAVLGRNGVGKTTLLRAIIGEIATTAGRIRLGEQNLTGRPAHERARAGIAYVPQGRQIFPALSVLDNLRVAGFGARSKRASEDLDRLLTEFPMLRDKRQQPGGSLSGGQQQILALARAMMTNPSVLLLDEPSEGVQPSIVDQIADTVLQLNRERGIGVVTVEQSLDFAARVATHAYLVDKGTIVRDLPAADLLGDRALQHEYLGV